MSNPSSNSFDPSPNLDSVQSQIDSLSLKIASIEHRIPSRPQTYAESLIKADLERALITLRRELRSLLSKAAQSSQTSLDI